MIPSPAARCSPASIATVSGVADLSAGPDLMLSPVLHDVNIRMTMVNDNNFLIRDYFFMNVERRRLKSEITAIVESESKTELRPCSS